MSVTLPAYAKVNLTLEVLGKRSDGYHEIASVMQTVSLADMVTLRHAEDLDLRCSIRDLQSDDNLALKAALALRDATGCSKGASIDLEKRIPPAAGLGSGSTDAAAALRGLNGLWELGQPVESLEEMASGLGSDVAFFIRGGTALASGRGEKVTPVPPIGVLWIVLLRPDIGLVRGKTAKLYSLLDSSHYTSGQMTREFARNCDGGGGPDPSRLFNVFEQVAFDFFPGLPGYRSRLVEAGAESVHLAGAGPALFATVPDMSAGQRILKNLEADGLEAYLVQAVAAEPQTSVYDSLC